MVNVPVDGGGGAGDQIQVDTEALHTAAPPFQQTGQQIDTLGQNLANSVQTAGGDMFVVLEFAKTASILEQLQERLHMAMQCAAGGLKRISLSLEIASELYVDNEDTLASAFTKLEDDKQPWNIASIITYPGTNPGGITEPGVNPGGITIKPVPNPVPVQPPIIYNPFEPDIMP